MTNITEIASDLFRICTYVPEIDLQFCQFLVRDEQPLLYHTGMRQIFPVVRESVAKLVDPATIRWIGFSHYEPDECGSLNDWLAIAPSAQAVCSQIGAMVFVDDGALRPARPLADGERLTTGAHTWRLLWTPHLPHGWDASMLFDETSRTLLCSDLLHQNGDAEPTAGAGVLERSAAALRAYQATPLRDYLPYCTRTEVNLARLAALQPKACATMHGSTFLGDGGRALTELGSVYREVLG
jgi:flavorubredoxin